MDSSEAGSQQRFLPVRHGLSRMRGTGCVRASVLAIGLGAVSAGSGCGEAPRQAQSATRAPSPERLIVPQRSIGTVRLGIGRASVRRRLGPPVHIRRLSESESCRPILAWSYPARGLRLEFRKRHGMFVVGSITTTSKAMRTIEGAGVAVSERDLTRKLRGIRCVPAEADGRYCALGSGELGHRQTVFQIRSGRVIRVTVFLVFP
jgi:hypothetical protein